MRSPRVTIGLAKLIVHAVVADPGAGPDFEGCLSDSLNTTCSLWKSPPSALAVPAAHRARQASPCPLDRPATVGRDTPTSCRPVLCANPRLLRGAAGNLVKHRVGETALRTRADGTLDREDVAVERCPAIRR
jgi:hypothetical protein